MKKASIALARGILLGSTFLTVNVVQSTLSWAAPTVGVTSATDGDPLGKPPTENERVLRIGIDVQANELVTTNANDRAHLVFLDGTSLTVGPNAQFKIDRFAYDPAAKTGDLAISASKGVFRLVGGKISKNTPITITTPSASIGIRGGIAIFTVTATQTTSSFIFGNSMTVNGQGRTQTVTRPGSQVTTNAGSAPGQPTLVPKGALTNQMGQLEGTSTANNSQTTGRAANADQGALGFSSVNSAQSPQVIAQSGSQTQTGSRSGSLTNLVNVTTNAISNADGARTGSQAIPPNTQASTPTITTSQATPPLVTPTPPIQPPTIPNTPPVDQPTSGGEPQPPTPPTTIIVTQGRFIRDPSFTNFNNSNLSAPHVAANNQVLAATGSVQSNVATITMADGRVLLVPWLPGQTFNFSGNTIFGNANGRGTVSPDGTFFGYVLTGADSKQFGIFGGTPTSTSSFPTTGFATHALTNALNPVALPFTPGSNPTIEAAATVSQLYSVYSQRLGVAVPPGVSPAQGAQSFQVSIAIAGMGVSQRSYTGAFIGDYFTDYTSNTIFNSGGYIGSYRADGTAKIDRLTSSQVTAQTAQGNAIYGPSADNMVYVPDTARTNVVGGVGSTTRTDQASYEQLYTDLTGTPYATVTYATKTATPATLGQTRTTQTMNGYVGGTIEARDASGNFSTRLLNVGPSQPTDVSISTDAGTNRAQGTIVVRNFDGNGGVGAPVATFQLGSTTGQRLADSAFIDDKVYGMRDKMEDATRFSKVTTASGDVPITSRTVLTSYNSAPLQNNQLPGGVTPCECAFMSWGWWSGDIRYDSAAFRAGERDRLHLATYVAGTLTNAVQLPNTGVATYVGHAVGNVLNGANSYVAAGTFTNVWSFANQRGAVTIGNFDGATYSGSAALTAGTAQFTGSLAGANRTGSLNGSFFSSPTNPVAGQGGNFAITGGAYKAGGTFAAQKQ